MLLQKRGYESRIPTVLVYFCKSHLIEACDARKYGVLMRYFENVFIRCFEKMAKDALKKMHLQVASKLAQDKCLPDVFSSCPQLILE